MKICKIILTILLTGLIGGATLASTNKDELFASGDKFFMLEKDGQISYALALNHQMDGAALKKMEGMRRAIVESSEIVFELPPGQTFFTGTSDLEHLSKFRSRKSSLEGELSPKALKLVEDLIVDPNERNDALNLRPGVALYYIKAIFDGALDFVESKYLESLESLDAEGFVANYGKVTPHPSLVRAAELMLRRSTTAKEVIQMSLLSRGSVGNLSGLNADTVVYQDALDNDVPMTYLQDKEPFKDDITIYDNMVTVKDLNAGLETYADKLEPKKIPSRFINNHIGHWLQNNLNLNFHVYQPTKYREMVNLIVDGMGLAQPGEDNILNYLANRHKYWVDTLEEKVSNGGVFIAIGGGHLVPGLSSRSSKTILEEFHERGIQVTPISLHSGRPWQVCNKTLLK